MNMNLLAVVTPPSIYHGCPTQKKFWEEKITPGDFTHENMKSFIIKILVNTERSRIVISTSPRTSS